MLPGLARLTIMSPGARVTITPAPAAPLPSPPGPGGGRRAGPRPGQPWPSYGMYSKGAGVLNTVAFGNS